MPMPTDKVLVAKADEVKNLLIGAFGTPPGYRPGKYLLFPLSLSPFPKCQITKSHSPRKRHCPNRNMDTHFPTLNHEQSLARL